MNKDEPRVRTTEELESDLNKITESMEKNKYTRTALSKEINLQKKAIIELQELIKNGNQINLFPNE